MPIASAAKWTQSPSANLSSRSSILSNGTPSTEEHKNNENDGHTVRRQAGGEGQQQQQQQQQNQGVEVEHDSFTDNPNAPPSSIRDYSRTNQPPSSLSVMAAGGGGTGTKGESLYDLYDLTDMQRLRLRCGEIAEDERLQMFILLLIAINSIMIGMATTPLVKDDPVVLRAFDIVDILILVVFTIESAMQLFFNGRQRFFKDGWLVFDLVIVAISWVSVKIKVLDSFRAFRALRFVTRISVLRNVVVALFSILPALTAISTLLLLIFYIFAVMFTQLFKDLYADGYTSADYFGRMDYTLFTLFQFLCLDEWSGIGYEVAEVYPWSWVCFVLFVVISAFVVVNLFIAVICDSLSILRTVEEAMLKQNLYGMDSEEEDEGGGSGEGGGDNSFDEMSKEKMRKRIDEMQKMMDEMAKTQETMSRMIQYLTLLLYSGRKHKLVSIREVIGASSSEGGSRDESSSLR